MHILNETNEFRKATKMSTEQSNGRRNSSAVELRPMKKGNQDSIGKILDFVEENTLNIRFSKNKRKIVLVMGNTGAGKTTLVSFLTKATLNSKETTLESGEYMIVDNDKHLISGLSTTTSETTTPNMMVHLKSGTVYYDCPGFNDTRGVANDISVTYFTRELIRKVHSVKFVFTVSYPSVQNGTGDRRDFEEFAKHATTFIKNIEKYKDGVAMVVTKVENRRVERNGQFHLVDDDKIINSVAFFLVQLRADLSKRITESDHEQDKYRKIITFINVLLITNDKHQYERIGILRLADRRGPMKDIPHLQTERRYIKKVIHDQLAYVQKEDFDFGYTISEQSKNRIHEIMEAMQLRLTEDVEKIGNEIEQFYAQRESDIIDIHVLEKKMLQAYEQVAEIKYEKLKLFEQQIKKTAKNLNINLTSESLRQFSHNIRLVNFLQLVSNSGLSNSFSIPNGLAKLKSYLNDSQNWYNFLIVLHDDLSKYDVQKDIMEYVPRKQKLLRQCNALQTNQVVNVKDIELKQLAQDIHCDIYYTIQDIQLNSSKLKILALVLEQALDDSLKITEISGKLVVKGYNVKISSIEKINLNTIKEVEVFALNNLFIDIDIKKPGQNAHISFVAPKWHIIGDRKIILNGKNGEPHSQPQATGWEESENNGLPGQPGGTGGNFLGIGVRSINDQNLIIQIFGHSHCKFKHLFHKINSF